MKNNLRTGSYNTCYQANNHMHYNSIMIQLTNSSSCKSPPITLVLCTASSIIYITCTSTIINHIDPVDAWTSSSIPLCRRPSHFIHSSLTAVCDPVQAVWYHNRRSVSQSLLYLCAYQQSYQHYHHIVQQCLIFRQAILNMQHYTLSSDYHQCNNVTMPSQLIIFHTCIVSVSPRPHMSISPSKRTQSPRQGLSLCVLNNIFLSH